MSIVHNLPNIAQTQVIRNSGILPIQIAGDVVVEFNDTDVNICFIEHS